MPRRIHIIFLWKTVLPNHKTLLLSTACRPVCRSHPPSLRVDTVLKWLSGSIDGKSPDFVSVYFSVVDSAGHEAGPQSPQVRYLGLEAGL